MHRKFNLSVYQSTNYYRKYKSFKERLRVLNMFVIIFYVCSSKKGRLDSAGS
jgi:hypothetical protein